MKVEKVNVRLLAFILMMLLGAALFAWVTMGG